MAVILKALHPFYEGGVQAIAYILSNEIWLVIGMCLCVFKTTKSINSQKHFGAAILLGVVFLILSIWVYRYDIQFYQRSFLLGAIACSSILMMVVYLFRQNLQIKILGILAKYTMHIFLMHTLFAAPLRVLLLKLGVRSAVPHIVLALQLVL